jgi:signal peptidase II
MKKVFLLSLFAIALFFIDRVTKILALSFLQDGLFYFQELIGLKLFMNNGIAFGLQIPSYTSIFTSAIIIIALIYLIIIYCKKLNIWCNISLLLIIIGAISNLLDRLKYEAIVDFIYIKYFPIFNLADTYIVIGAITFLLAYNKYLSTKAKISV